MGFYQENLLNLKGSFNGCLRHFNGDVCSSDAFGYLDQLVQKSFKAPAIVSRHYYKSECEVNLHLHTVYPPVIFFEENSLIRKKTGPRDISRVIFPEPACTSKSCFGHIQ